MRPLFVLVALLFSASIAAAEPLHLTVTDVALAQRLGDFQITLTLSPDSAKAVAAFTTANVGRTVDVLIDNKVVSSPIVRDPILSGSLAISGPIGDTEWRDLADRLRGGTATLAIDLAAR